MNHIKQGCGDKCQIPDMFNVSIYQNNDRCASINVSVLRETNTHTHFTYVFTTRQWDCIFIPGSCCIFSYNWYWQTDVLIEITSPVPSGGDTHALTQPIQSKHLLVQIGNVFLYVFNVLTIKWCQGSVHTHTYTHICVAVQSTVEHLWFVLNGFSSQCRNTLSSYVSCHLFLLMVVHPVLLILDVRVVQMGSAA